MASGLAHEINNPLAIINAEQTNIGDQIDELNIDNEVRMELMESVSRCKRQVARCGGITAKMLRFGRKTDSTPIETNIKPLLSESVQLMRKQAEINNIDLDLEIKDTLPLLLLDGNELEQVMVNLIGNAIYAIGKDGKIRITAERRNDEVMLSVEDNGCGIPQNDLDKVFQPFFTSKPVGKGTGLGLSVCYGIVRGWNGTIEASSELNKGTAMRIHLPVPNMARTT
jgi:two-component system NtrC family sensor kinase